MKSDLDFLNDTLSSPPPPSSTTTTTNSTTIDANEPNDLASILATLKKLSVEISNEAEGVEGEGDSEEDDLMIAELLAKMGQAEGAADGLEARLDSLLGRLDGMLGDLGGEDDDLLLKEEEELNEKVNSASSDRDEKKLKENEKNNDNFNEKSVEKS